MIKHQTYFIDALIYYTIFRHKCQWKVAILYKAFSSPPICCYFISFPNLLDNCDSAVKYSYNDSRKDRLSHFYHLLSVVISSHSTISLTDAIAQSSTATMIAVRIVFPIFITSCPLFCIHYTTLSSSTKV